MKLKAGAWATYAIKPDRLILHTLSPHGP